MVSQHDIFEIYNCLIQQTTWFTSKNEAYDPIKIARKICMITDFSESVDYRNPHIRQHEPNHYVDSFYSSALRRGIKQRDHVLIRDYDTPWTPKIVTPSHENDDCFYDEGYYVT